MANDDLPEATDYFGEALHRLDNASLRRLMTECEDWRAWMENVREGLSTDAGRTEWNVTMQEDAAEVVAACGRLQDEIDARETLSIDEAPDRMAATSSAPDLPANPASNGSPLR